MFYGTNALSILKDHILIFGYENDIYEMMFNKEDKMIHRVTNGGDICGAVCLDISPLLSISNP